MPSALRPAPPNHLCARTTDALSSAGWHPTDLIRVRLRTDVGITSPLGVAGWDAEAIADFGDTLQLPAIEIQDRDHLPVPGAHIVIPDASGPGTMLDLDNTPPSTTTTATSTTTTLPTGAEVCGPGAPASASHHDDPQRRASR